MRSYCQFNEDIFALNFVKNVRKKESGYFVDVGANDGVTGSNSMLLEENGWSGILVEANPVLQDLLRKNRPNANIQQFAISNQSEVVFHCVKGEGNLHGLSRIDHCHEFEKHVEKHGGEIEKHTVTCKPLGHLLKEVGAPKDLDFLSIDVEGHELSVLETLNFNEYRPALICLEDNSKGECLKCHNFMKSKGYVYIARTGVNDWFALPEYSDAYIVERIYANFTKIRWRTKTKLNTLLGLKKDKSHI